MSSREKVLGLIGLASRARKTESGEFSAEKAVKSGKAFLLITASDASLNTKEKFRNMCVFYNVPYYEYSDMETLGHSIGRGFRAVCAITDHNFSDAVIRLIEQ